MPKNKKCISIKKDIEDLGWKIANLENRTFSNVIETLILKEANAKGLNYYGKDKRTIT